MDACQRANDLLRKKLNTALDALENGNALAFDKALEDMVKIRNGMELGGCPLEPKKPVGFRKED